MEPDILASAGDSGAAEAQWPNANTVQTEDPKTVETPSDISLPRVVRLHAVSAHAPVVPRMRTHAGGFANGHARPRVATTATWSAAASTSGMAIPAVLPFETPEPQGFYLRHGKRAVDVLGGLVAMVIAGPIILLAAIAVKVTSRGPAFYKSTRLGKDGRPFTFYKLRSMYVGADAERARLMHLNEADGPVFKLRRDPRVTRVGQWLRSSSVDELPQLLNVLKGDMSLVGPRPPLPEEAERYEAWQRRRLDVKPGISCLWQVSGRSRLSFDEWMRLDLEYIRRQSLATDLWILLRTIPAVLSREGAY
jgi:lipopolysaccharide/colanic/teichoic acid biosynthesis glycosyltransferase